MASEIWIPLRTYACFSLLFLHAQTASAAVASIPTVVGQDVTLTCTLAITSGKVIFWEKDGIKLFAEDVKLVTDTENKYFLVRGRVSSGDFVYKLTIGNIVAEDDGIYACYYADDTANRQETQITVLVRPDPPVISGPAGVNEGSLLDIECSSDGSKPEAVITWSMTMLNGMVTDMTSYAVVVTDTNNDGTFLVRSRLLVPSTSREMYRAVLSCVVSVPALLYEETETYSVNMNVSPLPPVIMGAENGVENGTTVMLRCYGNAASPPPTVEWHHDGAIMNGLVTSVQNANGTSSVSNLISFTVTTADQSEAYLCVVYNNVSRQQGRQLVDLRILDVLYEPTAYLSSASNSLAEGQNTTLTCTVDGNPTPTVTWLRNDVTIDVSDGRYSLGNETNTTTLHISELNNVDVGAYRCQVDNQIGTAVSNKTVLNLLHRPVCRSDQQQRFGVSIGETLTISCHVDANPNNNVSFVWRDASFGGTVLKQMKGVAVLNDLYKAHASISYTVRTLADYKTLFCNASNSMGGMNILCPFFIVQPGPPDAATYCQVYGITQSSLVVNCSAGYDGGSPQHFLLQKRVGQGFSTIQNKTLPYFEVKNLESGQSHDFKVCASNQKFLNTIVCTSQFSANTMDGDNKSGEGEAPVTVATGAQTEDFMSKYLPYILLGVACFILLIVLVSIIAYCACRKKKNAASFPTVKIETDGEKGDVQNTELILKASSGSPETKIKGFDNLAAEYDEDVEMYEKAIEEIDVAITSHENKKPLTTQQNKTDESDLDSRAEGRRESIALMVEETGGQRESLYDILPSRRNSAAVHIIPEMTLVNIQNESETSKNGPKIDNAVSLAAAACIVQDLLNKEMRDTRKDENGTKHAAAEDSIHSENKKDGSTSSTSTSDDDDDANLTELREDKVTPLIEALVAGTVVETSQLQAKRQDSKSSSNDGSGNSDNGSDSDGETDSDNEHEGSYSLINENDTVVNEAAIDAQEESNVQGGMGTVLEKTCDQIEEKAKSSTDDELATDSVSVQDNGLKSEKQKQEMEVQRTQKLETSTKVMINNQRSTSNSVSSLESLKTESDSSSSSSSEDEDGIQYDFKLTTKIKKEAEKAEGEEETKTGSSGTNATCLNIESSL